MNMDIFLEFPYELSTVFSMFNPGYIQVNHY